VTKYKGLPKDCSSPGLILQLRERPEGGDLLADVHQKPPDLSARNEVFVLVHGFNNHYGEACNSYHGFCVRQYRLAFPPLLPPALEKMFAELFWPGDAAWGLFDLLDFLVYPAAVGTAKAAAPRLARYLRGMPSLRTVHFIAHSLGCRLVLETVDELRRGGGPRVGKVCLMAAAVPVYKVESGGALAEAMGHAEKVCILHSDDDVILRDAFPPGQTVAEGNEGFFPKALGLHGLRPGMNSQIDSKKIDGAHHGDYWGHSTRKPASDAAKRIADFCGFGSRERTIIARSPGSTLRSSVAESRDLGYVRGIG